MAYSYCTIGRTFFFLIFHMQRASAIVSVEPARPSALKVSRSRKTEAYIRQLHNGSWCETIRTRRCTVRSMLRYWRTAALWAFFRHCAYAASTGKWIARFDTQSCDEIGAHFWALIASVLLLVKVYGRAKKSSSVYWGQLAVFCQCRGKFFKNRKTVRWFITVREII